MFCFVWPGVIWPGIGLGWFFGSFLHSIAWRGWLLSLRYPWAALVCFFSLSSFINKQVSIGFECIYFCDACKDGHSNQYWVCGYELLLLNERTTIGREGHDR